MSRRTWVLFVGLWWIYPVLGGVDELRQCLNTRKAIVVADCFNLFLSPEKHWNRSRIPNPSAGPGCMLFVHKNQSKPNTFGREFPEMSGYNSSSMALHFPRFYLKRDLKIYVIDERLCNASSTDFRDFFSETSCINYTSPGPSQITCFHPNSECKDSKYDEDECNRCGRKKYKMMIRSRTCINCDNPVKQPEINYMLNTTFTPKEGKLDAAEAAGVVKGLANLTASINSSAALNAGEGVTGIIMKQTDPTFVDEMIFGYMSPSDGISILEETNARAQFSRSVRLSNEAFEKAISLNVSDPFGALLRFSNLDTDELNSTILGNEVLALEMGAKIANLTDKISIDFKNMTYEGIPTCHSWDGDGSRPNWTADGCQTIQNGCNITCECSHLTFFAILLVPLNDSIPSSDLNKLTIITQVGCGVSMFFLSIVLFMHLFRKTHASTSTMILIHLVSAMFLLDFTFLINDFVASLKSSVGCKIMAALMHYFMLATFTWFAAQAFHLCMLLYMRSTNRHYLLKVSIFSWVQPSIIATVMLIMGKYGERAIYTSDAGDSVAICWITDNTSHYVVNIGYYALVFIFTFTTFIIVLTYLFCRKRKTKESVSTEPSTNKKSITTILGLCFMTGITWGFAFFAYGPLRIPAYYIFTVLNSFQGFFLFIYYNHTSGPIKGEESSVNHSTLQTSTCGENPYGNLPWEKPGGQTGTKEGGSSA